MNGFFENEKVVRCFGKDLPKIIDMFPVLRYYDLDFLGFSNDLEPVYLIAVPMDFNADYV